MALSHIDIDEKHGAVSGYVVGSDKEQVEVYLSEYSDLAPAIAAWMKSNCSKVALLKNINVDSKKRNKGCGNDLLQQFFDESRIEGAEAIILISDSAETQKKGFVLERWYQDKGFVSIAPTGAGPIMVYPKELGARLKLELPAVHLENAAA